MVSRSGGGYRIKTNKVRSGPDQAFTLPKGTSAAPIKGKGMGIPTPKMMKKMVQGGTISTISRPSNAKKYVDLKTKMNKGKPDLVKQSGPSKTQVVGFGAAAGAGVGALATIKKNRKKK
jgi:hypothetical protein